MATKNINTTDENKELATRINRMHIISTIKTVTEAQTEVLRPQLVAANGKERAEEILAEFASRMERVCAYIEEAPASWIAARIHTDSTEIVREVCEKIF